MNLALAAILASLASFVIGVIIGCICRDANNKSDLIPTGSILSSPKPSIIINVPSDYKPLESLPPMADCPATTLQGEAARLWYTVYKETLDTPGEDSIDAKNAANEAVEAVFGSRLS